VKVDFRENYLISYISYTPVKELNVVTVLLILLRTEKHSLSWIAVNIQVSVGPSLHTIYAGYDVIQATTAAFPASPPISIAMIFKSK
jgi:hypothetical protein